MTTGTISLVVGNKRNYCLIKIRGTGRFAFAPRENFKDPEVMVKGANVKFRLAPGKPRPRAEEVEAA